MKEENSHKPKECKHKIEYGFPTCSKCGESIIVEPKEPQQDIKGWEEEFDKEVGALHQDGYRIDDFVKSFIRTLLAQQSATIKKELVGYFDKHLGSMFKEGNLTIKNFKDFIETL